ncbi:MAG: factor-independent urate hydroxylase [Pyrinomonadaceae bacterium]
MAIRILTNNYGKSKVRLLKIDRRSERQEIQNLTIDIALEGDFDAIHKDGDNRLCLPTDTMKNTVYALAGDTEEIEQIEVFGQRLCSHLLTNNAQVARVISDIYQHGWKRMRFGEVEHVHSFIKGSGEKRIARIDAKRDGVTLESGIEDLIVMKTTRSGFVGFLKDAYTTLPEMSDRVFSTAIKAVWRYGAPESASADIFDSIREVILNVFAEHDSRSVQHTLYAMGEAVLDAFSEIDEIAFSLPNIHYLPVDMTKFGRANDNRIFVPTNEPHGLIEARLTR